MITSEELQDEVISIKGYQDVAVRNDEKQSSQNKNEEKTLKDALRHGIPVIFVEKSEVANRKAIWMDIATIADTMMIGASVGAIVASWRRPPAHPHVLYAFGLSTLIFSLVSCSCWKIHPLAQYKIEIDKDKVLPYLKYLDECPINMYTVSKHELFYKNVVGIIFSVGAIASCAWNLYRIER